MFIARHLSSKVVRVFPSATAGEHHSVEKSLPSTVDLFQKVVGRDRYALARAITMVESTRPEHRVQSQHLLSMVVSHLKHASVDKSSYNNTSSATFKPAFRIGLSGSPGVGKSTFIETFGMHLIRNGHRVAVLAVDPSSSMTGGSILGDKTRMEELSKHDDAYVRPSPSSGNLGGVARNTSEAILLCEAAGYDVVLVETVGVGQSETIVADMVDMFALLVPPGGGDELQGIKKGIVELADLLVINKADGDLKIPATMTQLEYVSALKLLRPRYNVVWRPSVLKVSSIEKKGIDETLQAMTNFYKLMLESGEFERKRSKQRKRWMWRIITDDLISQLKTDPKVNQLVAELEERVLQGALTPGKAADRILARFLE